MKITQNHLRRIIKEEVDLFLSEQEQPGSKDFSGTDRLVAVQSLQKLSQEISRSKDEQVQAIGEILNSLHRLVGSLNTEIPGLDYFDATKVQYERERILSYLEKIK